MKTIERTNTKKARAASKSAPITAKQLLDLKGIPDQGKNIICIQPDAAELDAYCRASYAKGRTLDAWAKATLDAAVKGGQACTINPELAGKIRDCLAAIHRNERAEDFINDLVADLLDPSGGIFEGLIEREHEHQREVIEARLATIYAR